jgi:hypothetical protein
VGSVLKTHLKRFGSFVFSSVFRHKDNCPACCGFLIFSCAQLSHDFLSSCLLRILSLHLVIHSSCFRDTVLLRTLDVWQAKYFALWKQCGKPSFFFLRCETRLGLSCRVSLFGGGTKGVVGQAFKTPRSPSRALTHRFSVLAVPPMPEHRLSQRLSLFS